MEKCKLLHGLEELRQEREQLSADLKALNQNLQTLTGKRNQSVLHQRRKDGIEPDLNDDNGGDHSIRYGKRRKSDSGDSGTSPNGPNSTETPKTVRLSSVIVQPNRSGPAKERLEAPEEVERRKVILESQKSDKRVFDRNKRMFGMLMGTLERFKSEETDRERLTIKRSRIEERLDQEVERERASVTQEVERMLEQRQHKERLLDKADLRLDILDRFEGWDSTHRHLCNFIRTETKPKIFWLPKEHNPVTERRLKETRDYYGLCRAERTAKLKKEIDELDGEQKEVAVKRGQSPEEDRR